MKEKRGNVWLGAAGVVMNSKGEWLVVKKTYGGLKDVWSFPAGFVDPGETADAAAIREVKEETGIDCELAGMIGFRTGVLADTISDNLAMFLLRPVRDGQQPVPDAAEVAHAAYLSPYELKEDASASIMIKEIAEKAIESGLYGMREMNPGDWFGYTSYKLFFKDQE